jgi:hypothetical protein
MNRRGVSCLTLSQILRLGIVVAAICSGTLSLAQCNEAAEEKSNCWNDGAETFQILAGIEQAGASSLPNQTDFFLSGFTRIGQKQIQPWGRFRLLGAPTGSTGDVVASFQDPSGALKSLPNSKVGQSADFFIGIEVPLWGRNRHVDETGKANSRYAISFLLGGGATTPLSSQDVVDKFEVPAATSQQCNLLVSQFSSR